MATRLQLGAPGIYTVPPRAVRAVGGERMDVAAFVGVAPRGPAREPVRDEQWREERPWAARRTRRSVAVAVESVDAYRRLYGGFEGPGRLPYAVASFFEQGGARAYVVRIVHDYADPVQDAGGVARGVLPGVSAAGADATLLARSEGTWGNGLRAALGYAVAPLPTRAATTDEIVLDPRTPLAAGALLRLTLAPGVRALRFVAGIDEVALSSSAERLQRVRLEAPVAAPPQAIEVVEATLLLDDGAGRREQHDGLGLDAAHPRWLASVLETESILARADPEWADLALRKEDAAAIPHAPGLDGAARFTGGLDRYADLVPEDFFDRRWTPGDAEPGDGVYALTHLPDLANVVVPDLYAPAPLPGQEDVIEVTLAGPDFAPCVDLPPPESQEPVPLDLPGLQLDPRVPDDLERITTLQVDLVEKLAEPLRAFVVLLDVPPGLPVRQMLHWRRRFRSRYAACYHPWLQVARPDDRRGGLVRVNPTAMAAGIIAAREIAAGIPTGPANVLAAGVVAVDLAVPRAEHDVLHPEGINVFLPTRDGVLLGAARTLATDSDYRQLSVVRLVLMLKRALERQMQWVVFEPNDRPLRAELEIMVANFLRRLYRQGAFRGATETEAFFVRCGDDLNPPYVADAGQLICEIGIAPSEPVEFILLRLTRSGEGAITVEG